MSLILTLLETRNSLQKFLELGAFLFMYVPAETNSRNAFYLILLLFVLLPVVLD